MSEDDDDDKQHEASQKRLDDARNRGEVPKSVDLAAASGYAGLLLAALVGGPAALQHFGQTAMVLLDQSDRLGPLIVENGSAPFAGLSRQFSMAVAPFFLIPTLAVVLTLLGQRAVIFAPEKLLIKWSRISPIATAKQKFGLDGLFEFGKSIAKMIALSVILGLFLQDRLAQILASLQLVPVMGVQIMLDVIADFLFFVVLVVTVFGVLDYIWQRRQHLRRNRMSRKDMVDEMKDSEGDPHVKMQRRQRGQQIATNRMLKDVATADVILVNPTHYAVALKWNRKGKAAPICVAKGVGEIAARIRERAAAAGVPIHSDPPTARAIYATVDLGKTIQVDQYRAVAAAIRFAEAMRKRRKAVFS